MPDGKYTAIATEPSAIGNPEGKSETRKFAINTKPPELTCKAPQLSSSNREPFFSGTAGEPGTVTVHVYKGSKSPANEVATLAATVVSGEWITGHVKPPLADGAYIEYATEPSGLGNGAGSCEAPFNVKPGARK